MKVKLVLMSALVLAGCSEKYGDLHEWMNKTRADAKTKERPAEPPAPLEPVTYFAPQQSGPNAYSMQRMKAAFQNGSAPNLNRTKELWKIIVWKTSVMWVPSVQKIHCLL